MLRNKFLTPALAVALGACVVSCGDDGAGTGTTTTETESGGTYSLWGDEAPADTNVIQVDVPEDESEAVINTSFTWSDVAGWPAAADLTVRVEGDNEPLLQVFTENDAPFSRTGLAVEGLVPNQPYGLRLTVKRASGAVKVVITDATSGEVVVDHNTVVPSDVQLDTIEFVTPSANTQAARVALDEVKSGQRLTK